MPKKTQKCSSWICFSVFFFIFGSPRGRRVDVSRQNLRSLFFDFPILKKEIFAAKQISFVAEGKVALIGYIDTLTN